MSTGLRIPSDVPDDEGSGTAESPSGEPAHPGRCFGGEVPVPRSEYPQLMAILDEYARTAPGSQQDFRLPDLPR